MHVCTHAPVLWYKGPHRFLFPHISSLTRAPKQHPRSNREHLYKFTCIPSKWAYWGHWHTNTNSALALTMNTEHCSNLTASLYHQLWGSPDANGDEKTTTHRQRLTRKSQKHTQKFLCSSRTSTFYELCRSWGITSRTGWWWIVSRPTSHSHTTRWPFREHARRTLGMPFFNACYCLFWCVHVCIKVFNLRKCEWHWACVDSWVAFSL